MEQFDDILARQAQERDALERKEAEALIGQEQTVSTVAEPRGGSIADIMLLAGVVAVLLICLLALKFKQSATTPAAAGTVIAQQQQPAPAPVVNATYIAWDNNFDAALARAKSVNKPIMIDFYTDWCGVCKKVDSEVYTNQQVINEAQNFVNVKINAEQYTDLASRFGIHSYPTFVFVDMNGSEMGRLSGGPDPAGMLRLMQQYRPA